ncbi:MAG: hypothetical protein HGA82_02125, partial [Anaerolineales bacterium]|nr:hypothetical protein [Anaerolineales bacterium]
MPENTVSQFAREYDQLTRLYEAQPSLTRHFLDQQAAALLSALDQNRGRLRFQLPDKVILEGGESLDLSPAARLRMVGHLLKRESRLEKRALLIQLLNKMENGINPGLAVCAKLFRYALARTVVHHLLPDGRPVHYLPEADDDIPSIPANKAGPSAILAATDAVAELDRSTSDGNGLQVPYVAAARRFYLPQWVAFDEKDELIVGSVQEAEAHIASLQKAVRLLQDAEAICPSIVADEVYQRKRTGLLGQL